MTFLSIFLLVLKVKVCPYGQGKGRRSTRSGHLLTGGQRKVKINQKCVDDLYGWSLTKTVEKPLAGNVCFFIQSIDNHILNASFKNKKIC